MVKKYSIFLFSLFHCVNGLAIDDTSVKHHLARFLERINIFSIKDELEAYKKAYKEFEPYADQIAIFITENGPITTTTYLSDTEAQEEKVKNYVVALENLTAKVVLINSMITGLIIGAVVPPLIWKKIKSPGIIFGSVTSLCCASVIIPNFFKDKLPYFEKSFGPLREEYIFTKKGNYFSFMYGKLKRHNTFFPPCTIPSMFREGKFIKHDNFFSEFSNLRMFVTNLFAMYSGVGIFLAFNKHIYQT